MRLRRRSGICGAWDPPEGAGRDTHICMLPWNHLDMHLCSCGCPWPKRPSLRERFWRWVDGEDREGER